MENKKTKILTAIKNLIEVRELIFTQIVNLAMSGKMSQIEKTFQEGDEYTFVLAHFENIEDENVKVLVSLCKKTENAVYTIMNLNGITDKEVNL